MPFVSVVLPAYKATCLKEAVHSILSQTYRDFELIIVNDASPENVKEVVAKFRMNVWHIMRTSIMSAVKIW